MSEEYFANSQTERDELKKLFDHRDNGVEVAKRELSKVRDDNKSIEKAWRAVELHLTEDYVYVIRHEHEFVKIGWSNEPKRRLSELQKACPYDLSIETTVKTLNGRKAEAIIHDLADEYHKRGEWYDLPERFIALLREWEYITEDGEVTSDV